MCLSATQIDFPNSDNILPRQTIELRGMDEYDPATEKALGKDSAWQRINDGGLLHCRLIIRCQVGEDLDSHLLYNGRRYTRRVWSWRPPKIIRMQGRLAREYSDPRNEHPEIIIITQNGEALKLDACPCGGELIMDHRGFLYCASCHLIYE